MAQHDQPKANKKSAKKGHKKGHKKSAKKGHKRAKRNGIAQFGLAVLKLIGSAFLGTALAAASALLLAKTKLSGMAQDGILIAEGVVLGGAAHALGFPMLATAAFTATFGVAGTRMLFRQRADARVRQLVADATAASATATGAQPVSTPALPASTAPGGDVLLPGPSRIPAYNPYEYGQPAYG